MNTFYGLYIVGTGGCALCTFDYFIRSKSFLNVTKKKENGQKDNESCNIFRGESVHYK